ncbi:MAG: glycerate kinase [Gammaproteobacteria bacterium]|nr:glycerate kinase [Gammaproteobacteria bacterium]
MKILIAPDSFKESLSSLAVAAALERGLRRALPAVDVVKVPMADGGEGTVDALVAATGGRVIRRRVTGPLGKSVQAAFGLLGDGRTAIVEMAAASGLPLVPPRLRNPLRTTSYGTGELMRHALALGARRLVIGIGGSATNDGGAGMAQALGAVLRDARGRVISTPASGGMLDRVAGIELPALAGIDIEVACDVRNPLVGPRGASAIFGPQKGATSAMVARLDRNLAHFGAVLEGVAGRKLLKMPGGGAAGGMGAGLVGVAGARLRPGVELVMDTVGLRGRMAGVDLVITGEGRIDYQTVFGKTPAGVAALAGELGIPVVAVGGGLADDAARLFAHGVGALESAVVRPLDLDEALENSSKFLISAGERIGRWLLLGTRLKNVH